MDYLGDRYAPGLSFVRSAMARAVAKNEQLDPVQYCIKRWGRETEAVRLVRSAVAGGESSSGNWSGLTDNYLRVFARGDLREGQITPVRLDELAVDGILGQIAEAETSQIPAT